MATLVQCDFCGKITNQIAAQVQIVIHPHYIQSLTGGQREAMINLSNDELSYTRVGPGVQSNRDCCGECVKQFLESKQVPLSISPEVQEKL